MRSTIVKPLAFAIIATLGMAFDGAPVRATNINVAGVECVGQSIAQFHDGVRAVGNSAANAFCSVARSALTPGLQVGSFYIDGDNFSGQSTTFQLNVFDYTGTLLSASVLTTSLAHYDLSVGLYPAQLPTYAYVSVIATLPANGAGVLRGITSIQ